MTEEQDTEVDEPEGVDLDTHRLDLRSADVVEPRARALADLYPEAVHDGKLDLDALAAALGDVADNGPERFGLTWPGKAQAIRMAQRPSDGTLVPMRDESVGWGSTQNVIIEGENLEVLKLLQRSYHGKVKLIYIDPPYNTGKEFVYPDNFRDPLGEYLRVSGQVGEDGGRLRANAETSGRYHSAWLSMMWPRLHLARSLLADDGLIAVSIDDHEAHDLRAILNEIFGEENFIATVIWHKMDSPKNSARHFSEDHEYLVLFARDAGKWRPHFLPRTDDMLARYKNPDDDQRGPWLLGDLAARNPYDQGRYAITTPSGRVIDGPPPGSYWRVSKAKFDELDADGRIWWGDGNVRPGIKRFLSEVRDGVIPQTYWHWREVGSTRNAKQELHRLMDASSGDDLFVTPKPTRLLSRLLQIATDTDSLVLDFFAGSGTLGEAVSSVNKSDGGTRRFVLVQFPEETGNPDLPTIAAIVRARLQAVDQASEDSSRTEGFRAYRLDTSAHGSTTDDSAPLAQMAFAPHLALNATRDDEALLVEVLLNRGFDLVTPVSWLDIDGLEVASVASGALVACFARLITTVQFEALIALDPAQLILLEEAFGDNDEVKVNALQHLKTVNEHRETGIELLLL